MKKLLAKSESRGRLWLEEHTAHVVIAIEHFAANYGVDVLLARKGAVLHDLGKGHPIFQAMLIMTDQDNNWKNYAASVGAIEKEIRKRKSNEDYRPLHRHEISSLAFLPLFDCSEWNEIIEMVAGHHKSVEGDKSNRGFIDMIKEDLPFQNEEGDTAISEEEILDAAEDTIDIHLDDWENWSPAAIEIVESFGLKGRKISRTEAEEALNYAILYLIKKRTYGWSNWRGLLMSADHFASGYQDDTKTNTVGLFKNPDISCYQARSMENGSELYPLSKITTDCQKPHTIIVAPTGAGKTDFLVRRCKGRFFYTLPFQASINAMWKRFLSDLPEGTDIRRLHSASKVNADITAVKKPNQDDYVEDTDLQSHPGAAIKVLTPHQLAALVFCTPGHEAIALDVRGSDIILDEIHTYSEKARIMVREIVRVLTFLKCRIHIGTATMPSVLFDDVKKLLGGDESVYSVKLTDEKLDEFNRHLIVTEEKNQPITEDDILPILKKAIAAGEKVLLVANRVATAQRWYDDIVSKEFSEYPSVLIHSRYRRKDRAALENEIIRLQNPNEVPGAAIAVSTQVVEVSLDISYDRMITEAAPLDALIQRFGRVNRKRVKAAKKVLKPIHILEPAEDAKKIKPYDKSIVDKTYEVLKAIEVFEERNAQKLIDEVFGKLAETEKSHNYQVNPNGTYRIKKLEHRPRGVIVEVLEIEGNTCIRYSDLKDYKESNFKTRPLFEIPVPASFGRYNNYPIEESGSYPLVIPDDLYEYEGNDRRGLITEKQAKISKQLM